jgi:ABC-type multidrug transport system fused ATPase/permease subunit
LRFAAIRTVNAFRTQDYEANRYARHAFASYLFGRRLVFLNGACDILVRLAFEAMVVGGIYFAGRRVLQGDGTVGETVTYLLVVMDLAMHVESIPESISGLSEGVGASVSLVRIITARTEQTDDDSGMLSGGGNSNSNNNNSASSASTQDLELVNVSFAYPSRPSVPVIRELSLRVKSGHTVAIVGKSGSGKTSLVSLLVSPFSAATRVCRVQCTVHCVL